MAKHLTKNEILRKYAELQQLRRNAIRAPFTGMATLCNWVLWKEEGWYQKKLAEYNQRVLEYNRLVDDGIVLLEDIRCRIKEKAGFDVMYVEFTEADIKVPKKDKMLYSLELEIMAANNTINELSTRYMLIHYQVLMDMGYGEKRLNRNMENVNRWLRNVTDDEGDRIMDLRQQLIDGVGIYIEMPDLWR